MFSSLRKLFTKAEIVSLTQRRRQRRFNCYVPVLVTVDGQTEPAMIADMAEGGLRIMIRQRVKAGAVLKLHYAGDGPSVNGRVVWSRRNGTFCEVGVTCQEGPLFWVQPLMRSMSGSGDYSEVRQTVRFVAPLNVAIAVHFGPSYVSAFIVGQLADLSLGGAAFCGPVKAQVGTVVELRIEPPRGKPLTVLGRVVRQSRRTDGRTVHGIRFESMTEAIRGDLSRILLTLRDEARASAPTAILPSPASS